MDEMRSGKNKATYEQARSLLEGRDKETLLKLASEEASYPEMLYFLSTDNDPEIRTRIAENPSTPIQADEVLSKDTEPAVRLALGAKIARRLPTVSSGSDGRHGAAVAILEHLIVDAEVRVRAIIAEELKASDKIPLHLIQKLARDINETVSTPILTTSPLLDDQELISIIKDSATTAQLKAISERSRVSEPLAECIVESADIEAISHLLLNPSAQIRENTLDLLITGAKDIPEWHEPLVIRPELPTGAVHKIADFVATSLLEVLSQRHDIDDDLRAELECRVQQRLSDETCSGEEQSSETFDAIECRLRQLHAFGDLSEDYIKDHIERADRNVVILSLAVLADIPLVVSRRIFVSLSAKAIMSLAWKAGISAALAAKIQMTVGNIPTDAWILPDDNDPSPKTKCNGNWHCF